jgi:transposase
VIREAADRQLSTKRRGRLVRELAAREHVGPFGTSVRMSRETIDRWIRAWRRGGFDALVPNPRRVSPAHPARGGRPRCRAQTRTTSQDGGAGTSERVSVFLTNVASRSNGTRIVIQQGETCSS